MKRSIQLRRNKYASQNDMGVPWTQKSVDLKASYWYSYNSVMWWGYTTSLIEFRWLDTRYTHSIIWPVIE